MTVYNYIIPEYIIKAWEIPVGHGDMGQVHCPGPV